MINKTKVYVKLNEDKYITDINSSIFLLDLSNYIEIDEGEGDRYAHAQAHYLDKAIVDEQGRYNYKLADGKVVEVAEADKPIIEQPPQITTEDRLAALESAMLEMILGGTL